MLENNDSISGPDATTSILEVSTETPKTGANRFLNKKLLFIFIPALIVIAIAGGVVAAIQFGVIPNPLAKKSSPQATTPSSTEEVASQPSPQESTPPLEQPSVEASDDQRYDDIEIISTALDNYYMKNVAYPSSSDQLVHISSQTSPCIELLNGSFLTACPHDPAGEPAFYGYRSDGTYYELTVKLDTCTPESLNFNGTICISRVLHNAANRDATRISDINSIALAAEVYTDSREGYPPASSYTDLTNYIVASGFMTELPKDPSGGVYSYVAVTGVGESSKICTVSPCSSYIVAATLEGDAQSASLQADFDGNVLGMSCDDPVYCTTNGPAFKK